MFYDSSIIYSTLNSYCKPSTILGPEEIAVNITKWGQEYKINKHKYQLVISGSFQT